MGLIRILQKNQIPSFLIFACKRRLSGGEKKKNPTVAEMAQFVNQATSPLYSIEQVATSLGYVLFTSENEKQTENAFMSRQDETNNELHVINQEVFLESDVIELEESCSVVAHPTPSPVSSVPQRPRGRPPGRKGGFLKHPISVIPNSKGTFTPRIDSSIEKPQSTSAQVPPTLFNENDLRSVHLNSLRNAFLSRFKKPPEAKRQKTIDDLVVDIERANWESGNGNFQKSQYRSLIFNIRDTKNCTFYKEILKGKYTAKELSTMKVEDMASKERKALREKEREKERWGIHQAAKEYNQEDEIAKKKLEYFRKRPRSRDYSQEHEKVVQGEIMAEEFRKNPNGWYKFLAINIFCVAFVSLSGSLKPPECENKKMETDMEIETAAGASRTSSGAPSSRVPELSLQVGNMDLQNPILSVASSTFRGEPSSQPQLINIVKKKLPAFRPIPAFLFEDFIRLSRPLPGPPRH